MKKYTANYAFTNPNFVVQNLVENEAKIQDKALLFVLKNILQRGFPTILSEYLQEKLGRTHLEEDFRKPFLLISPSQPKWINTIKGDEANQ
jgi:ATP-dependent DNA helicase RecQ